MQDYDVTLKTFLRGSAEKLFEDLTGAAVAKWLDIELPKIQNPRMDLQAETADGAIAQLELQSSNDSEMHCGWPSTSWLSVLARLEGPRFSFSYELVDIRDLDGRTPAEQPTCGR
jgi:hypothetical protein